MSNVTTDILDELKSDELSSWAVWNEDGNNTLDFFQSKLDILHSRFVFLGLNRSNGAERKEHTPFRNFHAERHVGDNRLKKIIQDEALENLVGSFMTDLTIEVQTDSSKVKVNEESAINRLKEKLSLMPCRQRSIICFGEKVFESICGALKVGIGEIIELPEFLLKKAVVQVAGENWTIYRVWHYSNYGRYLHKSEEELPKQLRYVNTHEANE
ncbi:hypothetical protein [Prolixibacter denitrificans]|uniref:Uncharacterized protein n=1 Tax=Prolixibacter denitrificans TaxID=1541063 RepID=A0A2P8CCT5_9BACT|nr:hypothetical protein [Prolixibacter denitrificans]PSK82788.1 hypothetical protein CLV93_105180 [Prolixibacter denitrificans]GET21396.1 hypothetical protein JCM18694_16420 [Prolixibacter denitrificans]